MHAPPQPQTHTHTHTMYVGTRVRRTRRASCHDCGGNNRRAGKANGSERLVPYIEDYIEEAYSHTHMSANIQKNRYTRSPQEKRERDPTALHSKPIICMVNI